MSGRTIIASIPRPAPTRGVVVVAWTTKKCRRYLAFYESKTRDLPEDAEPIFEIDLRTMPEFLVVLLSAEIDLRRRGLVNPKRVAA